MMEEIPRPAEPVRVALIGAGNRASTIYQPLFAHLRPWVEVVAVCDPVQEHGERMAAALGAKYWSDVRQLVKDRPMEAGLIVAPVPVHYAVSILLSSHGVHNHCETTWCSMVEQGREMVRVAREQGVVARVAENFFRFAVDRFAQRVQQSDCIGRIGRVFSYDDHTGYHNNSRWIRLAGAHPLWVQALEHHMETPPFRSMPHRFHQGETFRSRFFLFPGDLLVVDQAANVKGWLGRHPRPGYTEWQGERGTLVHRAAQDTGKGTGFSDRETQLRRCSGAGLDQEHRVETIRAVADEVCPVVEEGEEGVWRRTYAQTRDGLVEYVNAHRPPIGNLAGRTDYGVAVVDHVVDFALAVRGLRASEFDEEDALASLAMEAAAFASVRDNGRRVALPMEGEVEFDAEMRRRQRGEYGVDPMDVEAMLAISYARP